MRVLFIGDIHGRVEHMKKVRWLIWEHEPDMVVFVGDTLYDQEDFFMSSLLSLKNKKKELLPVYVLGGNHENYDKIESQGLSLYGREPELAWNSSNVYWLPHGSVLNIKEKLLCFVGGGISIDVGRRTLGVSYWAQEEIDMNRLLDVLPDSADILVTHDSPNYPALSYKLNQTERFVRETFGQTPLLKSSESRINLDKVFDILKPELAIHGHYHWELHNRSMNAWGECQHVGLSNIDEPYILRHQIEAIKGYGKVVEPAKGSWFILDI